jgi:hypothetical protein
MRAAIFADMDLRYGRGIKMIPIERILGHLTKNFSVQRAIENFDMLGSTVPAAADQSLRGEQIEMEFVTRSHSGTSH